MPVPDSLSIVMAAAEVAPFAKVGGLADVVGALPKFLRKLGAKVDIIIPAYKLIHHDRFGIRPYEPIPDFDIPMGPGFVRAEVYQGKLPGTDIDVFLIGCGNYFYRDGMYDDPASKEGYLDNMERFVFFMKAVLEVIRKRDHPVDVIHCHDSQTGLLPALLGINWDGDPFFSRTGTLFTIHNLAYQGLYPKESLYWAGIDYRHFYPTSPFEFWGKVNFMKVGIEYSDAITTVSQTYAKEIQTTAEFGCGLEGVLRSRKEALYGIVNGIDYEEWNPETDPFLPVHFSNEDLSGKAACKSDLLKTFGLPESRGRVPLIGIVSRLADQKGFDLLEQAMEEIASLDLQIVVLGTGQKSHHEMFERFAARYPNKIGVRLLFDNKLAHQIEAGADMFLMPSRYEPCGLNQLYSLRYATVPIVRATGGLVDTVKNYDIVSNTGTGFSFENYAASEMVIAIKRALLLFSDADRWRELMLRGMSQDWSWENSARQYMSLYQSISEKKH